MMLFLFFAKEKEKNNQRLKLYSLRKSKDKKKKVLHSHVRYTNFEVFKHVYSRDRYTRQSPKKIKIKAIAS